MIKDSLMLIIIAIILPVLVLLWFYFSESSKTIQNKSTSLMEENIKPVLPPQITVIFQKDISDEEELIKEVADMYISNRTYYYSGKHLSNELLSEKKELDFVKYDSIDFVALKRIDV